MPNGRIYTGLKEKRDFNMSTKQLLHVQDENNQVIMTRGLGE